MIYSLVNIYYLGFYKSLVNEKESINIYLFIIGAHYSTDTHVYSGLSIKTLKN